MPKLTVVLPTYNEKENLSNIVNALFALDIPMLNLLVVDDTSPDGTGQIADALAREFDGRMSVYHRTEKNGLGPAYRAGFRRALAEGADYIVQMDADFSHQPHYIYDMLSAMEDSGADMVLGSRFVKGGSVDKSWGAYRKLLSWWANRVYVPTILRIPVYDATGGYRLWRRETLIGLDLDRVQSNGYVFQVEMAYVTVKLGYRVVEVPIHFPDRQLGESKMDSRIALEAAWRTWSLRSRHHRLTPQDRRTAAYPVV
ncbi:MAG: polyprenol monophosphomannose synthase [Anaerolineaceae bacterium]|nr:MAG: polyprenol monophosphomannose synthase [Anaerolineaceae bacterium]